MKRLTLATALAVALLCRVNAGDGRSLIGAVSVGANAGSAFHADSAGFSAGIGLLADLDRSWNGFTPYVGANLVYGAVSAFEHDEQDFYATFGGGLGVAPFSGAGLRPLGFRFGVDVGGGYTKDVYTTGRTAGVGGFLVAPKVGIEYKLGAVALSLSSSYSCIITAATTKRTIVGSLGVSYIVKGAAK
jgi:hypothetical protein